MARERFSEDDYKATVLEPKLERLNYPHRDINFCTRGSSNRFRTWSGDHDPDYIFWFQGKPILDVEAKPRESQFDREAFPQATFHARNFVSPGTTEVQTIPYILCAAGERMEMFRAVPTETSIDIHFERLPRLLSWQELIQQVQATLRPATVQQVSQTTLGLDALAHTFDEIYQVLSGASSKVGKNPDEILMKLNDILLQTVQGVELEKIQALSNLSKRAINRLSTPLFRYPLHEIKSNHLAYAYRKFVTQFFQGKSAAFNGMDIGRYLTPSEIIDFMVKLSDPQPDERIIDFACGSGGFVGAVAFHVAQSHSSDSFLQNNLFACDVDPFAVSTTKTFLQLLLSLSPDANLNIFRKNGLVSGKIHLWEERDLTNVLQPRSFDLVISNPPAGDVYQIGADEKVREVFPLSFPGRKLQNGPLFVVRAIQLAKIGGGICLIIPDGILANEKLQYVRDFIDQNCEVRLVVSLPRVFPNVPSKMSILFMERVPHPKPKQRRFMAKVREKDEVTGEEPTLESELTSILQEYQAKI